MLCKVQQGFGVNSTFENPGDGEDEECTTRFDSTLSCPLLGRIRNTEDRILIPVTYNLRGICWCH
jgi:hypothetical protein